MIKVFNTESGLTLVEILFTFAMLGFFLTAIYSFYSSGLSGWQRSVEKMEYQQTARAAMDKMINELRFAHIVKFNAEGRCQSNNAYDFDFNKNYEIICFRVKKAPSEEDLTLFRFRRLGEGEEGQLIYDQRKNGNTHYATNVVALYVTGLSFSIDDEKIIHITISVGSEEKETVLTGSVRPRNMELE